VIVTIFAILIKKWIKLGLAVLFKKKTVIFIANENRRLELHVIKVKDKSVPIDDSVYFVDPKKSFLMSLAIRLHLKKKKELPIILEPETNITEYDIDEERLVFFGNTPCYLFRKDNPEAIDLYSDKTTPIVSGSYLNLINKKALLSGDLEFMESIKKYLPFIIIVGGIVLIILAGAVAYFLIKGLTPTMPV